MTDGSAVLGGRFRLGPVIGIGSTAMVHRGHDLRTDHPVAVKIFHPGASGDDRCRQERELQTLSRLDHPGLVRLRHAGTDGGRPFVVTDLIEGPNLGERIAACPLTVAQVRQLGCEIGGALAHVHAGGFVHRDVKPANVLLGDGTRARLADFGIAKAVDAPSVTGAGLVVGTAAYLAPEQARGEDVGPPADVYALGLVLLEALTGRREYPGVALESANARLHRRPDVPAGLPGDLTTQLRAMTADDPAHRPSAAAVSAQFAAAHLGTARLGRTHPDPARAAECPPMPARHRADRGRGRVAVPVAAAALLVAVAGGAAVWTSAPTPDVGASTEPVDVPVRQAGR